MSDWSSMMIYFDNGATTALKPKCVLRAVKDAMKHAGGNAGRGGHILSQKASDIVYSARESVCRLFNIDNPERVCFTNNATSALNFGIKGIVKRGDHIIISKLEHNSVLRPVEKLRSYGVDYDVSDAKNIENYIRGNTKLIVINHASNVTGEIQDIESISKIAHKYGIIFMVDASQSAGHINVDVKRQGIDVLACAGHKGLFGPQGSGILYVKDGIIPDTIIEGGTGSLSELLTQPLIMPDRLEAGTLNVPAIAGLKAGIDYVLETGQNEIRNHELELTHKFMQYVKQKENITLYGPYCVLDKVGITGINIKGWDSVSLSTYLSDTGGICTRGGLHCSYLAHKHLGTLDNGILRISFSYLNTIKEVTKLINFIDRID